MHISDTALADTAAYAIEPADMREWRNPAWLFLAAALCAAIAAVMVLVVGASLTIAA